MITLENNHKVRCFGNKLGQDLYAQYHDYEWGVPVYDDQRLFEFLVLEGAQAGLSWETILKRRANYAKAFYHFDPVKISVMSDQDLEQLRSDSGIIRNKLKIYATRKNAQIFLTIQRDFGTFSKYLWAFVDNKVTKKYFVSFKDVPVETETSILLSKDLSKRGMKFVGPKIMYAFMQAVGMVDDHLVDCWRYKK